MKILLLGPKWRNKAIMNKFMQKNIEATIAQDLSKISNIDQYTHLITSGYHLRVPEDILNKFDRLKRINIHATFLPFGKGIGTALFALVYPVPLGVTLHIIDPIIDEGNILSQSRISLPSNLKTQREIYNYWINKATEFFLSKLDSILSCSLEPYPKNDMYKVPYFSRNDSELHLSLLPNHWDTSKEDLATLSLAISLRLAYKHVPK